MRTISARAKAAIPQPKGNEALEKVIQGLPEGYNVHVSPGIWEYNTQDRWKCIRWIKLVDTAVSSNWTYYISERSKTLYLRLREPGEFMYQGDNTPEGSSQPKYIDNENND